MKILASKQTTTCLTLENLKFSQLRTEQRPLQSVEWRRRGPGSDVQPRPCNARACDHLPQPRSSAIKRRSKQPLPHRAAVGAKRGTPAISYAVPDTQQMLKKQ